MRSKLANSSAAAAALSSFPGLAAAAYQLNMQEPQAIIAQRIFDLHTLIMWICVVIFVGVFAFMFYAIYKHRKSAGHKAALFHENITVEIIWTIIPFFILVGMAYPATRTVIAMKDTSYPDLTIKVTGYQWKWQYEYLQDGISFYSNLATPRAQIDGLEPKGPNYLLEVDNPMVVPTGKKVRVLLTANDVIHAWWVPALGVKQDAIPGFIRDTWFRVDKPGTYRGQCAELCGKEHGFMPIVVEAKTPEDYAKWLAEQKTKLAAAQVEAGKLFTPEELKIQGEKVYAGNCAACHQANGKGIPGTFPPLDGSKVVTGARQEHIKVVLNGRTGTPMPSFKQLSDVELAALITYERNAWGNKTGDVVQPSEVLALRK